MAKKIVITSGKGGVGKTTVTANLGHALADLGLRVCLLDIDFGLNNLDVVLGLEHNVIFDIKDVLEGRCRIKQALVQDKIKRNLCVLPSNKLAADSAISGQNVKLLIESISYSFDYVLLDCPAGIDVGFHRAVSCADMAIVVTTPNLTSLRDADKVISILKSYRLDYVGLVVNRVRGDLVLGDKMIYPEDAQKMLKTELLGVLPDEDTVFLSCGGQLGRRSQSLKAYKILADNLHFGRKKIFNATERYSGFLGSIRRGLKGSI